MTSKNNLFLLSFFLVFVLGAFLLRSQQMTIGTLRTALDQEAMEELGSLGENVKRKIDLHRHNDSYTLNRLAKEAGVKQILLIENDGTILADSTKDVTPNERIPLSLSFHKALEGNPQYRIFYKESQRFGEILLLLTPTPPKRILRITTLLRPVENPGAAGLLLWVKLIGWIGGSILVYSALRFFLKRSRSENILTQSGDGSREDGVVPWMGTFQGIVHQLKQKERMLTQMNENILQSVTSGVISFNPEGKVITVNPAAEAILAIKQEALLGTDYRTLFGASRAILTGIGETLKKKREAVREECEMGEKKWLGFTTSALRDPQGTVIGAIIVFVDLTEIKALQATVELKKRFEIMGEISAWVAHEFRNYLGTIMGYVSLLSKEFLPAAPQHEMTRAITQECVTMEQLIANLFAYGKNLALTFQETDLAALIEEILSPFRSGTPSLQFVTALTPCKAAIDPVLIRQVLSNLIQNGIEAMRGNGTLTLQLFTDNDATLKISDSGQGIPQNQLDKIFLPFFTTRERGSGLGLAFAQKIILAHSGTIAVESLEGKGTTFTITLPLHRP